MAVSRILRPIIYAIPLLFVGPATLQAVAAPAQAGGVTVTGVALHVESAASAINPSNPSLSRVRAGQPFRLILYARLTGLTAPVTTAVSLRIVRGGHRDFASQGSFTTTQKDIGGGTQGTRWFWNVVPPCGSTVANCLPRTPGSYTVTGTLTVNGKTYTQGLTLTEGS